MRVLSGIRLVGLDLRYHVGQYGRFTSASPCDCERVDAVSCLSRFPPPSQLFGSLSAPKMASTPPSQNALSLLDNISKFSDGLKNGQQGAREGLLGACSQLISELSHPSETILNLLWSQPSHHSIIRVGVDFKLFQALKDTDGSGKPTAEIAAKCDPPAEPAFVGILIFINCDHAC